MTDGPDRFPNAVAGLPAATPTGLVSVADGEMFDLRIAPVAKRLGDATVRMLAYNGSVPGPILKVKEGSEVVVNIENQGDREATVHWHGLRLENRYDGTHETQAPIPVGGTFSARCTFPDPGVYWYHPHTREDYGQEMGLYRNIRSRTWSGRTRSRFAPARPSTSFSTSPIRAGGWPTATSPSTTRAG
jgi:FtsP/CotA-like multicopper oxidase with cupredoxin domain